MVIVGNFGSLQCWGAADRAALLLVQDASLPEGQKGWGLGSFGPALMGGCAAAETRSLHCGALSGCRGQDWRGGGTAPEVGGGWESGAP